MKCLLFACITRITLSCLEGCINTLKMLVDGPASTHACKYSYSTHAIDNETSHTSNNIKHVNRIDFFASANHSNELAMVLIPKGFRHPMGTYTLFLSPSLENRVSDHGGG